MQGIPYTRLIFKKKIENWPKSYTLIRSKKKEMWFIESPQRYLWEYPYMSDLALLFFQNRNYETKIAFKLGEFRFKVSLSRKTEFSDRHPLWEEVLSNGIKRRVVVTPKRGRKPFWNWETNPVVKPFIFRGNRKNWPSRNNSIIECNQAFLDYLRCANEEIKKKTSLSFFRKWENS